MENKIILDISKLENFQDMNKICRENFCTIGMGSSRNVFDIGESKVLKLALNYAGLFQNSKEAHISKQGKFKIIPSLYGFDENYKWIIVDKVNRDFDLNDYTWNKFNFSSVRLFKYSDALGKYIYSHGFNKDIVKYQDVLKSEIGKNMFFMASHYKIILGDCKKKDSWGLENDKLVILDYGLTGRIFNVFFNESNFINESLKYEGKIDFRKISDFFQIED